MSETTPVTVEDNPQRFRYEARVAGELAAFTRYQLHESTLALTHTETVAAFQGKGVAGRLAAGALDSVRERGLALDPQCPFIRGYIVKHPQYLDLVPASLRSAYDI